MPRKSERPQRAALTRMLRATGLVHIPEEAPLVELLRALADEIDAGGGSRVRTEYRNALKDARAVLGAPVPRRARKATPATPDPVPVPEPAPVVEPEPEADDLQAFKKRKGLPA